MTQSPYPLKERLDMVAHYKEGMTLREVADLFVVSIETVRKFVRLYAPGVIRPPHVVPERRRASKTRGS